MTASLGKIKLFLFIGFICFLINMVATVISWAINGNINTGDIINMTTIAPLSFLPFFDLINLAFMGLPIPILALFSCLSVSLGIIKLYLLYDITVQSIPIISWFT